MAQLIQMHDDEVRELDPGRALLLVKEGLQTQNALISGLMRRVSGWESNLDRRAVLIANQAAEEVATRMSEKLLAELTGLRGDVKDIKARLTDVEQDSEIATKLAERASQAHIVIETGPHKALDTSPPEVTHWKKKLAIFAVILAGVATAVGTAVQAYRAAVGP